ncbi:MAG TPA: DOMON-like domain-containing protein [Steroidobacteraceae bacterium]|jgi:hypothetical protein|nr:DOMON-like domain-containing protein [Steroidobacteraceae bacterium]
MTDAVAVLEPHPARPAAGIRRVAAAARLEGGTLRLQFRVEGDPTRLRLPLPAGARRRDGLWQHTCFEAFLRPDASDSYYEFNLSPSGEWAAYRYDVRRGGCTHPELPVPSIDFAARADGCDLNAAIPVAALAELAQAPALAAGLTAVIEQDDGALSYWALAHAGASPDFHDPTTFRMRLVPA